MSRPIPPSRHSTSTPPPIRPHPLAPYHPSNDTATYRDLLLFEERLKSNAEMLRRRRQRYSVFLWSFVTALFTMGYRLLVQPPRSMLKLRALQAATAVVFITLALFFASGMYQEKIRYAHGYINHSNKSLRPLNMHLNMRRSTPSFFPSIPLVSHLTSKSTSVTPGSTSIPSAPQHTSVPSTKPFLGGKGSASFGMANGNGGGTSRKVSGSPNVMAVIPPSSNPRGELIFASRVDRAFREGYERYRAAFERRREEKAREEALRNSKVAWLWRLKRRSDSPSPGPSHNLRGTLGTPTPTSTPPISRRDTPPLGSNPHSSLNPTPNSQSPRRSSSPSASGLRNSISAAVAIAKDSTAPRGAEKRPGPGAVKSSNDLASEDGRQRSESYSFVLDQKSRVGSSGIGALPRKG